MHAIAACQPAQCRVFAGKRHQRHLDNTGPGQCVHRQAHAVHRDRAMQHRGLCDVTRHANIDQQRVVRCCNPLDRTDAIHMSLDEVPAQPIAGAHRAFQIDRPAFAPLPNQRTTERRGDGMNGEPALYDSLDRQASTVDGDALALLDATIPRLYPQFRASALALAESFRRIKKLDDPRGTLALSRRRFFASAMAVSTTRRVRCRRATGR